jgi:hypothetical protein
LVTQLTHDSTICYRLADIYPTLGIIVGRLLYGNMFFIKIMKRILIAEVRRSRKHSSKRHYLLLLIIAVAQLPLLFWLGNVCV